MAVALCPTSSPSEAWQQESSEQLREEAPPLGERLVEAFEVGRLEGWMALQRRAGRGAGWSGVAGWLRLGEWFGIGGSFS